MFRAFCRALLMGFAVMTVSAGAAVAADDGKCTIATDGDNDIVKACKAGGIKRAKVAMKSMAKLAKEKGMKTECDSCHKNETDWKLTDNAEADFKKMLELINKK